MAKRYVHFSAEQLAIDAERITIYDTLTTHLRHTYVTLFT